MNSYGENLLKKYGWNEGKGIGKNDQGIVNPIKASFKFDNTGVGFDQGEEFTVNWWEHLFNHTAKKIKHDKPNEEAQAALKKPEVESPEKAAKTFNNKSLYYARFQKAGTLENGFEKPSEDKPEVVEKPVEDAYDKRGKKIVSDEDLYKICEGRTAHKGARHGIKMNGKLARIIEQEQLLLKQSKPEANTDEISENNETERKKKKKNKHKREEKEEIVEEEKTVAVETEISPVKKKKKNKSE